MISIISDKPLSLDTIERMAIEQTLAACKGNKSKAAEALDIYHQAFWRRLHRLGLFEKYKVVRKTKTAPAVL